MSEAVPSIMAQNWLWGNQEQIKQKIRKIDSEKQALVSSGKLQGGKLPVNSAKNKPLHGKLSELSIWVAGQFFHKHWRFSGQQGKGGGYLYSSLPLSQSAHRQTFIICNYNSKDQCWSHWWFLNLQAWLRFLLFGLLFSESRTSYMCISLPQLLDLL